MTSRPLHGTKRGLVTIIWIWFYMVTSIVPEGLRKTLKHNFRTNTLLYRGFPCRCNPLFPWTTTHRLPSPTGWRPRTCRGRKSPNAQSWVHIQIKSSSTIVSCPLFSTRRTRVLIDSPLPWEKDEPLRRCKPRTAPPRVSSCNESISNPLFCTPPWLSSLFFEEKIVLGRRHPQA